jgi:hypothetical protein
MDSSEPIVCSVTAWFYRRTILPGVVCLAIAGWFFFDGTFVYPEWLRIYQEYRAYDIQRELLLSPSGPLRTKAEKDWKTFVRTYPGYTETMSWTDLSHRFGWPEANPPEWREYAKSKGYSDRFTKKRIVPSSITGQFVNGAIFFLASLTFLGNALLSSRKKLRADDVAIDFPDGKRVPFDHIVRVDNRKWNDQGISLIEWTTADGKTASCRLDCLKFDEAGAERIMQRILATQGVEVQQAS